LFLAAEAGAAIAAAAAARAAAAAGDGASSAAGTAFAPLASLAAGTSLARGGGRDHDVLTFTGESDRLGVVEDAGSAGRAHAEGGGVARETEFLADVVRLQRSRLAVADLDPHLVTDAQFGTGGDEEADDLAGARLLHAGHAGDAQFRDVARMLRRLVEEDVDPLVGAQAGDGEAAVRDSRIDGLDARSALPVGDAHGREGHEEDDLGGVLLGPDEGGGHRAVRVEFLGVDQALDLGAQGEVGWGNDAERAGSAVLGVEAEPVAVAGDAVHGVVDDLEATRLVGAHHVADDGDLPVDVEHRATEGPQALLLGVEAAAGAERVGEMGGRAADGDGADPLEEPGTAAHVAGAYALAELA